MELLGSVGIKSKMAFFRLGIKLIVLWFQVAAFLNQ